MKENHKLPLLKFWLCILGVMISASALADPSPAIRYLMNQPVSLLDWGLSQMRQEVESALESSQSGLVFPPGQPPAVTAAYNWDRNQIDVQILYANKVPDGRGMCRRILTVAKGALELTAGGKTFYRWTYEVQHSGYTASNKEDAAVAKSLPRLVLLSAVVFTPAPVEEALWTANADPPR